MTRTCTGCSTVEVALDAFTPVDHSVYESLSVGARQRHADDIVKRLSVAAELSREGAANLIDQALATWEAADVVECLDALVEFGRLPSELTEAQREQAQRSQIRDEILHFDRIMDLEALKNGRDLKRRREHVWDVGAQAAAERLLTLTYERRVLRGDESPEWLNMGADQPGRIARVAPAGAVLTRDAAPQLVAVASGPGAEACLQRLQRYCGKHPLGVAIGLLDYEMYMNGEQPCGLAAAATANWFGDQKIKIWACGDATVFKASRDGHDQIATDLLRLTGGLLGSRSPRYGRAVTTVDANDRLVLVLGHHGHDEASLSKELSRPNRKTRIHLNENLSRTFPSGLVAVLKPQVTDSHAGTDAEVVRNYLTSATASHAGPVTLSVEVGHVHADRELGPIQERGIDLGGLLAREISAVNRTRAAGCAIDVEVVPMIDDDHVVNRLSYSRYQGILANKGVPAAEIVLESSPIILDIACDLLKTAVRGDGRGYVLENRGDNLYLESGALRLELVESTDQEMRVGCIVYDTALTVYRSARAQMQELFRARTGHLGNVHQEMIDTYDSLAHPQERAEYRQRLDKLWKKPFSSIIAEPATPYLDVYRDVQRKRAGNGEKLIVLNILEDYYEPLELKVRQLAELLGVDISLDCLLFSPYGAGLRSIDD